MSLLLLPLKVTILKHIHEDVTGAICTSIKRNIITRQVDLLQRMMAFYGQVTNLKKKSKILSVGRPYLERHLTVNTRTRGCNVPVVPEAVWFSDSLPQLSMAS